MGAMKQVLVFFLALLTWCGCKEESTTTPPVPLPSGTATVTDTVVWPIGGGNVGFDCDLGKTISGTDTSNWHAVDIVPSLTWIGGRNRAEPYLYRPGDSLIAGGFRLISKAGSYQDAFAQFQALTVAPDTGYQIVADSVQANQVWAFQTVGGKSAKLLLREVHLRYGATISDTFATAVTFDWVFQPNGSRQLVP